MAEKERICQTT